MSDILARMVEALPMTTRFKLADPIGSSWIIIQAAKMSGKPEHPAYGDVVNGFAQLIKAEPTLRAEPDLLALADEVLGPGNLIMTPNAVVQKLEQRLEAIRKGKA